MAPDDGTGKPGGSDKPPGLQVFKKLDDLIKAAKEAEKKGFDTEFVLAVYKE